MSDHSNLLADLVPLASKAGEAIMEVYHRGTIAAAKADGSPVTEADQEAEAIILEGLKRIAPDITIVSEENSESHNLSLPEHYFLVDPLDGTREFIKADGQGSFTVNIALIENDAPVLGVIFAPALNRMFKGSVRLGAWEGDEAISVRAIPQTGSVAVASVSHRDVETNAWLQENEITETVSIGSSLKFCLIACGEADLYPRFGPTMEWDTAAGHAILSAAGGNVTNPDGSPFTYGKPGHRNGPFIANGGS